MHQVDNPAFGPDGTLYATFSGTRGQRVPVSVFRVARRRRQDAVPHRHHQRDVDGLRRAPARSTSRAASTARCCKVQPDGTSELVAHDLGVACGIAFGSDGTMFVGDRSGTVFRIGSSAHVVPFVSLPPSLAAFHLAMGPDDALYVTGPTMATYDHVYRVDRQGAVSRRSRPSSAGRRAWRSTRTARCTWWTPSRAARGSTACATGRRASWCVAAPALVGVAIDPRGGLVVASNDTIYRLDVGLRPWRAR